MNYQWFPGHMTKAFRMMQENIKLVDLIIELTDARVPKAGRNPDLDAMGKGKARLLLLNKADLADEAVTAQWIAAFTGEGVTPLPFNAKESGSTERVRSAIRETCRERIERDRKRGIVGRPIRAMVAGIPNVGKSTFINRLAARSAAKTGNKPGVTKGKQWISLGKELQLLDTPGVLWPKFEEPGIGRDLAMIGSLNDENLDLTELAAELIILLQQDYPEAVTRRYGLSEEPRETALPYAAQRLAEVAEAKNLLKQGGVPDMDRAASLLLEDFRSGRLGRISLERP